MPEPTRDDLDPTLLEGIAGTWFYHLGRGGKALCGNRDVMQREVPISCWGFRGHLRERYCQRCAEIGGMDA